MASTGCLHAHLRCPVISFHFHQTPTPMSLLKATSGGLAAKTNRHLVLVTIITFDYRFSPCRPLAQGSYELYCISKPSQAALPCCSVPCSTNLPTPLLWPVLLEPREPAATAPMVWRHLHKQFSARGASLTCSGTSVSISIPTPKPEVCSSVSITTLSVIINRNPVHTDLTLGSWITVQGIQVCRLPWVSPGGPGMLPRPWLCPLCLLCVTRSASL